MIRTAWTLSDRFKRSAPASDTSVLDASPESYVVTRERGRCLVQGWARPLGRRGNSSDEETESRNAPSAPQRKKEKEKRKITEKRSKRGTKREEKEKERKRRPRSCSAYIERDLESRDQGRSSSEPRGTGALKGARWRMRSHVSWRRGTAAGRDSSGNRSAFFFFIHMKSINMLCCCWVHPKDPGIHPNVQVSPLPISCPWEWQTGQPCQPRRSPCPRGSSRGARAG